MRCSMKKLQGAHKGVERVRVHVPRLQGEPEPTQKYGKCKGNGVGGGGCRSHRERKLQRVCNLHGFLWSPPDQRMYVELRTWGAAWAALARCEVSRLVEHAGPIEQVWFVLRSGVAAWLQKQTALEGFVNDIVVLSRKSRKSSLLQEMDLPFSSTLVLVEMHWNSAELTFTESLRRFLDAATEVESIAASLWLVPVAGCIDCLDFALGVKWRHQSTSVLSMFRGSAISRRAERRNTWLRYLARNNDAEQRDADADAPCTLKNSTACEICEACEHPFPSTMFESEEHVKDTVWRLGAKLLTPEEGTICPGCTAENPESVHNCQVCGWLIFWSCQTCTLKTQFPQTACEACGTSRFACNHPIQPHI
jgi:hypothetical protein